MKTTGSLKPAEYASIMAYLLMYDCVTPSHAAKQSFPTTNAPAFSTVIFGGRSCPSKAGGE
jgi:hypothetical protein